VSKNTQPNNGLASLGALLNTATKPEPQTEPAKLSPLARCYISESVDSQCRVPSLKLKPDYRAELLARRQKLLDAAKLKHSEAGALIHVVRELATDPINGLFDAQKILQATMGQVLWMAAVDLSRAERAKDTYNAAAHDADLAHGMDANRVGREGAPSGLEGASDNEDAIMGFAGDGEEAPLPTASEITEALVDVNLWINTIASAITLLPLPYTVLNVGHNARGKVLYRPIDDPREALDIQQDRNRESMNKRNAQLASEAIERNAATFDAALAMVA
jgi:hypothetical protein